ASGVNLARLLGTGYGPVIVGRAAWRRVSQAMDPAPATVPRPLLVAGATLPLPAEWSTLPRLALVDQEADSAVDPGACVELGRARRLEQVDVQQAQNAGAAACAQPCDEDPRSVPHAQNSAAYVELDGAIPVAIIEDSEPLLQGLRAAIRPDGPELDGIVGAAALQGVRVEIDYRGQPAHAIFSCDGAACRAVGRCPRLPGPGQTHTCFGLAAHGLPGMCNNLTPACP